jgi:uncharacterized oligopeptide transporter (OPT) family protein
MPHADASTLNDSSIVQDAERALRIEGFSGTPAQIDRQWYEEVYRGRGDTLRQLTLRAVVMGMLLGGVLSVTNLYIGLKAGWSFGVTVTACILSYGLWSVFLKTGLAKTPLTILENNCMQSAASSSGYSTGSTLVSSLSAYFMINGHPLAFGLTLAWIFLIAVLGVTMAIPMKRQMINIEQLRFPTGIATAETLRALYSRGLQAAQTARALGWAAVAAALSQFWSDGLHLLSTRLDPFSLGALVTRFDQSVFGKVWMSRTVMFVWDPVFIAGGTLMGLRSAASIFLGGTLCWGVFVPVLQANGVIRGTAYRDLVQWTLWGGVSCMVSSGLLGIALQWRLAADALAGLRLWGGQRAPRPIGPRNLEAPIAWCLIGQCGALLGLAALARIYFGMPVWQCVVAVLLSFVLALVACRVTGETDTTPQGAMAKVTQLIFGALNPGNMTVNLMSANISAGAVLGAADLLTDLKSGYLLGANPRKQFLAQFCGIFIGTLVAVSAYRVLVPTADVLGSDQFPAPAAQSWRAVALALSHGLEALGSVQLASIAIGALLGVLLTLWPRLFPRHATWVPSPAGFGLAWTFHWYYGLLFFIGGLIGWFAQRQDRRWSDLYSYPIASGVIAGGSLMGVALIFWENLPLVWRQLHSG